MSSKLRQAGDRFVNRQLAQGRDGRLANASFSSAPSAELQHDVDLIDLAGDGDQGQSRGARFGLGEQRLSGLPRSGLFFRFCHLPGRNSFRLSMARSRTSAGPSPCSSFSTARPAPLSCEVARMSTIFARCSAGMLGVEQAFFQQRQDLRRTQFPHQPRDLVVPGRELLVEVGQDDVAALLVVLTDGDADRGEIEAILAVVLLRQIENPRAGKAGIGVAEGKKKFAANSGASLSISFFQTGNGSPSGSLDRSG